MSEDIKVQHEGRWWRRILIVSVVLFLASTAWNVGTRISTQAKTTSSIVSTIEAIEKTCKSNQKLTRQYRVRAKDEVILTRVALIQTYSAIAFFSGKPGTSGAIEEFRNTLPGLKHILKTIKILPLPDCKAQADALRTELPPG
jgi:hypothetical protein